ncbi:MAG: hypothetical protein M3N16_01765 [Actinomycetota bacterium]|nr:hypothetical protein [Actinomycetota bacterium]
MTSPTTMFSDVGFGTSETRKIVEMSISSATAGLSPRTAQPMFASRNTRPREEAGERPEGEALRHVDEPLTWPCVPCPDARLRRVPRRCRHRSTPVVEYWFDALRPGGNGDGAGWSGDDREPSSAVASRRAYGC